MKTNPYYFISDDIVRFDVFWGELTENDEPSTNAWKSLNSETVVFSKSGEDAAGAEGLCHVSLCRSGFSPQEIQNTFWKRVKEKTPNQTNVGAVLRQRRRVTRCGDWRSSSPSPKRWSRFTSFTLHGKHKRLLNSRIVHRVASFHVF